MPTGDERTTEAHAVFDDVSEQSQLITDWEEIEHGVRAWVSTDEGRIQSEFLFHDDGAVTERVSIIDSDGEEVLTDQVNYEWPEVQRHFLRVAMQDITDRAGNSRRIRLTESEAKASTSAIEKVVDVYEDELNEEAVEDLRAFVRRTRNAFIEEESQDGYVQEHHDGE